MGVCLPTTEQGVRAMMKVAIIVAMSTNRVIGHDNKLPWHIPADLKHFKALTLGKPIVMGRKTYESIGKPLPGRDNIVITRQSGWKAEGVKVAHSLEAALDLAQASARVNGAEEIMVIGGAEIYAAAMDKADRMYMTQVQSWIEGDAIFPEVDWQGWQETARQECEAEGANPFDYSFIVFDRLTQ
jgi:dihydrofolate reductase